MKKTCWNCDHYHDSLVSPEGKDFWHIHDYCDAWDRSSMCSLYSRLCEFLDDEFPDVIEDVIKEYGGDDIGRKVGSNLQ